MSGRVATLVGLLVATSETEAPTQTPPPAEGLDTSNTAITAGLGGFFVLFGLALALWFIGRDLFKRIRRMNQGEILRQRADQRQSGDGADTRARTIGPRTDDVADRADDLSQEKDPLA